MNFNRKKFQELVLLICNELRDVGNCGQVKLAKLLYFIDFQCYLELGAPATGATYQKLEHGPAAREYLPAKRGLIDTGAVREIEPTGRFAPRLLEPLRPADTSGFSEEELRIAMDIVSRHKNSTGRTLEELSHEEYGWRAVSMHDTIPYATAWIDLKVSQRDRDQANAMLRDLLPA